MHSCHVIIIRILHCVSKNYLYEMRFYFKTLNNQGILDEYS